MFILAIQKMRHGEMIYKLGQVPTYKADNPQADMMTRMQERIDADRGVEKLTVADINVGAEFVVIERSDESEVWFPLADAGMLIQDPAAKLEDFIKPKQSS